MKEVLTGIVIFRVIPDGCPGVSFADGTKQASIHLDQKEQARREWIGKTVEFTVSFTPYHPHIAVGENGIAKILKVL